MLYVLLDGRKRHGEPLRLLPGISPKTLTDRLREFEQEGLLVREHFAEIPPRVEYELTERTFSCPARNAGAALNLRP